MHSLFAVAKLVSNMSLNAKKASVEPSNSDDRGDGDENDFITDKAAVSKIKSKNISGNLNKLHPVLFWDPPPMTYLEVLNEEHFIAHCKDFKTRPVLGDFFFDPSIGTSFPAGEHDLKVTFIPTKRHKYVSIEETRKLVIKKRKPVITWDFPGDEILFGTILSEEHFKGVTCELAGGEFIFSHEIGRLLPIGKHKMTVEYEPPESQRCNYSRAYASVSFEVVGTYVPIVWKIPFSVESYGFFAKHVESMMEANTFVVSTAPAAAPAGREEESKPGSRGGRRARKKQLEEEAEKARLEAEAAVPVPEFTPDSKVVITSLPAGKRSSAFFIGAPIVYPDPLPDWLYQAQAVFFNAETQESEYVPGRMEYEPAVGTQLPAGDYSINLTFYPDNVAKYRVTRAVRKVSVLKSPVPLHWPTPIGMTEGATLDAASLNCTNLLSLPGTYTYDPPLGTALLEGRHILNVRFDPEDATNYHSAATSTHFQVRHKKVPNILWANPPDIVHPFPLSRLQLNAACRGGGFYRGEFVYEPGFGTVLDAGVHQLKVTFIPELPTVQVVSGTVELVVHQGLSRLVWNTPEPLFDGQGLYDDVLTCKCTNLRGGTFNYDPPKGTVLNAGPHRLHVHYIPDDPNYMEGHTYINMDVKPKPTRSQSKYYSV